MVWILQFIHVYLWTEFNTLSRSLVLLISFRSLTIIKTFDNLRESIGCVDFFLNRNLIKTAVVFFARRCRS